MNRVQREFNFEVGMMCFVNRAGMFLSLLFIFPLATLHAAAPGIPFTEDFSAETLMDSSLTNANWSTTEQAVYLASQITHPTANGGFASTGAALGSSNIDNTASIILGDVDGDDDLDLIVANDSSQANRLYLNDGSGGFAASGTAIGSEAESSRSVSLADMDGDGDLDLVVANNGANRFYRNDGNGDFGASGTAIGTDTDNTYSIALGDVDEGNSSALRKELPKHYNGLQAYCIMLFCLLSAPCIATFAITRRESNSWFWAFFQLFGLTVLAYVVTTIVYQVGILFMAV